MKKESFAGLPKRLFLMAWLLVAATAWGQPAGELFHEGFEVPQNALPEGWINEYLMGEADWQAGIGAGEFTAGQSGLPDSAAVGQQNAYFRVPAINAYVTRLISPLIDAGQAVYPELSFWHAQYPRNGHHSTLKVYYAQAITGPYMLLAEYPNPVSGWIHRVVQLPAGLSSLYLAFEGHSGGGTPGSVCLDEVLVTEMEEKAAYLDTVTSWQPTTALIPTGSADNPVLKTELRVIGNTGSVTLDRYTAASLNTDDQDLAEGGVKLWFSAHDNFAEAVPLGSAHNFVNDMAVFENLNQTLPIGYSYLWISYDIDDQAVHGNYADAYLPAGGLVASGTTLPLKDQDPLGRREIRKRLFSDDFETDKGWVLSGEWQRAAPQGLGGYQGLSQTEGPADPQQAASGTMVLGTDLTGLGAFAGNYEATLPAEAWQAIMPARDFSQYNNIILSFKRWLNVYFFDKATIELSTDGGQSWETIWYNNLVTNTSTWSVVSYELPQAARQEEVLIRFTLGDTGGTNLQSGWNIDDVVITGSFVALDAGVAALLTPESGCGLTAQETVSVQVTNYGTQATPELIPMAFSLDGGDTWQHDTLRTAILAGETTQFTFAPKADFSVPGRYHQVLVKTMIPGDEDLTNDQLKASIFAIPTLVPGVTEDFEQHDGFWTAGGTNNTWRRGIPAAPVIDGALSGSYAWVTNPLGYNNPSEHSWVESPCFDFTNVENPVLDFFLNTNTYQGIDGVAVDYSLDGGATWKRLMARSPELARHWYNHAGIYALGNLTGNGHGWTGNSQDWINPRIMLPEETGNQSSVKLRMVFASSPAVLEYEGAAFDRISVYAAPDDLALTAIISPTDGCTHSATQALTVEITNMGINTIPTGSIIPVGLDDHATGTSYHEEFALTGELGPGQQVQYTFKKTFDMQQKGSYTFTAYTMLEESGGFQDTDSNNSLQATITNYGLPDISLGEDIYTTRPDTLLLDAGTGFTSYLWQDASQNQTFQVTSIHTAEYHVTVTDHNGCEATDSIRIIAYDLAVTGLLSPAGGCQPAEGSLVTVRLHNEGVDAMPTGTSFELQLKLNQSILTKEKMTLKQEWLPGASVDYTFTKTADMPQAGTYSFEITLLKKDADPDNNILTATATVSGYPSPELPANIVTSQPDTLLLDAGAGFASYHWSTGSTSQTLQVPDWGSYWVVVTNGSGCEGRADVTIDPEVIDLAMHQLSSPDLSCREDFISMAVTASVINKGNIPLPAGRQINLKYRIEGKSSTDEVFTLSEELQVGNHVAYTFSGLLDFIPEESFTIRVWLEHPDDGLQDNNHIEQQVGILPSPTPFLGGDIHTHQPDTLILDAGQGYAGYLWQDGLTTTATFQVAQQGLHWVEVTDNNGCKGRDSLMVELLTGTTSPGLSDSNILLYPNPAGRQATLKMDIRPGQPVIIELWTRQGTRLLQRKRVSAGLLEEKIDLEDLPAGMYFIRIMENQHVTVKKLMVTGSRQ